jgi:hypothetical protein
VTAAIANVSDLFPEAASSVAADKASAAMLNKSWRQVAERVRGASASPSPGPVSAPAANGTRGGKAVAEKRGAVLKAVAAAVAMRSRSPSAAKASAAAPAPASAAASPARRRGGRPVKARQTYTPSTPKEAAAAVPEAAPRGSKGRAQPGSSRTSSPAPRRAAAAGRR